MILRLQVFLEANDNQGNGYRSREECLWAQAPLASNA